MFDVETGIIEDKHLVKVWKKTLLCGACMLIHCAFNITWYSCKKVLWFLIVQLDSKWKCNTLRKEKNCAFY